MLSMKIRASNKLCAKIELILNRTNYLSDMLKTQKTSSILSDTLTKFSWEWEKNEILQGSVSFNLVLRSFPISHFGKTILVITVIRRHTGQHIYFYMLSTIKHFIPHIQGGPKS